jgi:hypothetical protein
MARMNPADRNRLDNEGKLACNILWRFINIADNLFRSFHSDILSYQLISRDKYGFCFEVCRSLGDEKFLELFKRLYPDKYSSKTFLWLRENYQRLLRTEGKDFLMQPLEGVTLEDCQ